MADAKISALTAATTPLAGTEVLPIVQSGATKKVSVDNLTVGKTVETGPLTVKKNQSGVTTEFKVENGNAGANSDVSHIFSTANGNWTVKVGRSTGLMTWTSANAIEVFRIANAGDITLSAGNFVQGTAAKGINFTANTPAAGMTSQLLNWYEEGTYTPAFTAESGDAPVIGNGTLTGKYTRIGRQVKVDIYLLIGSTTTMGNGGVIRFGLPFTAAAASAGAAITSGTAYIDDTGTGWTMGFPVMRATTYVDISLAVPGTIGTTRVTNTAPMTWATGDSMVISFVYTV